VLERHGNEAAALDPGALRDDIQSVGGNVLMVLRETQSWMRMKKSRPEDLYELYEMAERRRKGRRARLPKTPAGREKRREWLPDRHTLAAPLHYRWRIVCRLLADLRGDA